MEKNIKNKLLILLVLIVTFSLFSVGCTTLSKNPKTKSGSKLNKDSGPVHKYYDFTDVLIPGELSIEDGESIVYMISGKYTGILAFTGRVTLSSLIEFFEINMEKDNWQLVSSNKSSKTLMMFKKSKKWCLIRIDGEGYSTRVRIWVTPTTGSTGSGLLKGASK